MMNSHQKTRAKSVTFGPLPKSRTRQPTYGQVWNSKRWAVTSTRSGNSIKRSHSLDAKPNRRNGHFPVNQINHSDRKYLHSFESLPQQSENLEDRPSSIYRHNSRQFLQSLRSFRNQPHLFETELARYVRMSRELVDDFVRLKSGQIDESIQLVEMSTNGDGKKTPDRSSVRKRMERPKSASEARRNARFTQGHTESRSAAKMDKINGLYSEEEETITNDHDSQGLEPLFHRSMDKISSIANWERQIRYELEIEKELQKRELERQREKLKYDQRKLEEWDKQLRIELDARERKLRLGEEELKARHEDCQQKSSELTRREQMINEIVSERIKAEMKFEIEKLRKKFNELEVDKSNLSKKEERVREVEARLHEQVKIVKEKIDSKRMTDIELAKYRKELEIVKKENEVFKEKVDSMEDYQVAKFENRALKSELHVLKEALETKNQEIERDRERWEKEQRCYDQKVLALRTDLRKAEQELQIQRQRALGDLEEMTSKYEAANLQVKRLQAFVKDHLAKLNNDFSATTQTLYRSQQYLTPRNGVMSEATGRHYRHYHSVRSGRAASYHQRSVSMDGHEYSRFAKSSAHRSPRGCHLCEDEPADDDYNNNHARDNKRNLLIDYIGRITDEDEFRSLSSEDELRIEENGVESRPPVNGPFQEDQVVQKIVNKIYEKMSSKGEQLSNGSNNIVQNDNHLMHEEVIKLTNGASEPLKPLHDDHFEANNENVPELNDSVTPHHRSLYEELLLASEVSASTPTKPTVTQPPAKANTLPSGSEASYLKLHNDNNNNMINALLNSNPKKTVLPTVPNTEIVVPNQPVNSGDSSSKSESFEIDW